MYLKYFKYFNYINYLFLNHRCNRITDNGINYLSDSLKINKSLEKIKFNFFR